MPIYEYHCKNCNKTCEVMQNIRDPLLTECAQCHGELEKLVSSTSFQLKGGGWYVTDFKDSDKKPTEKPTEEKSSEALENKPATATDQVTTTAATTSSTDATTKSE
jgi:putative FmdB family regulatory protein